MRLDIKISVVIPTFQRSNELRKTIASVIAQELQAFEIIIVDDGSTDDTRKVVQELARDHPQANILYFYKNNGGAQSARNRGIVECNGDYIQFVDSDDLLSPTNFRKKNAVLRQHDADMVVSNVAIHRVEDGSSSILKNSDDVIRLLASGGSIHTSAPLLSRDLFGRGLIWNPSINREQDKVFAFRAALMSENIVTIDETLSTYVIHSGPQISDSYHRMPQFKSFLLEDFSLLCKKDLPRPVVSRFWILRHIIHMTRRAVWYFFKRGLLLFVGRGLYDKLRMANK